MSAEYLRSYLRAIDETPLEMQLGVTQLTNQDFEAIEMVKQISATIAEAKKAKTKEERAHLGAVLQDLFKKVLYRVQMQGEISTELGLRINATQRELGAERGHWESGAYIKREAEANYRLLHPEPAPLTPKLEPQQQPKRMGTPQQEVPSSKKKKSKKSKTAAAAAAAAPPPPPPAKVRKQEYCKIDCTLADGEMVGCDAEDGCPHGEWFHLTCVGLKQPPPDSKKWYCPDCRPAVEQSSKKKK